MLIADAQGIAEKRGAANLILVVGDIAYAGKETEYKTAGEWLDQLTRAVKCRETDVRMVPGNHDCDRGQLTRVARTVHREIRNGTPKSAYADLEDMAKGAEGANPLLPKLRAYRDFAAGYESDFISVACPFWTKDFALRAGITLRIVGMNSVQVCDNEDKPASMILGNRQYTLHDERHIVYAVMMHHPLHWFMDKDEAKAYLHNRARLFMVGHEHIPDICKTVDVLQNEWLDIYSGATNPPESGPLYRYSYNWIEISLRDKDDSHVLAVHVFPRVWIPEQTKFGPDTQRLAGKESAEFEITCQGLQPMAVDVKSLVPDRAAATAAEVPRTYKPAHSCSEEAMSTHDEAAVAKLKFLFWRYLDWQQRLKVLVQADALPSTANQPVPQTMERLALESARQRGTLAAIWDAMMEYVPENKKQANPFKG